MQVKIVDGIVAGSGHTESKSPLKFFHNRVIFICMNYDTYIICSLDSLLPLISYLKIQTGNSFSTSHEIVGTKEIGASVQFKFLHKPHELEVNNL